MVTLKVAAVQTVFSGLTPGDQYLVKGGGHTTTASPPASGRLVVRLSASGLAVSAP